MSDAKKRIFCIGLIVLGYVFTYLVPIVLLYFSLKESFITTYVTEGKVSLSFIGFVVVSGVASGILLFKLSIKLYNAKASIFKSTILAIIFISITLLVIYILTKLLAFTYVLEQDTVAVIRDFRNFVSVFRKNAVIFCGCLILSAICNIVAIVIDKEYVKSLNWL
jgi:hypothetical protein